MAPSTMLRAQLHRMAHRVAENRVVAGLHFPIDSIAGQMLGIVLARYMLWRCDPAWQFPAGWKFGDKSATVDHQAEPTLDRPLQSGWIGVGKLESKAAPSNPHDTRVLRALWAAAAKEW